MTAPMLNTQSELVQSKRAVEAWSGTQVRDSSHVRMRVWLLPSAGIAEDKLSSTQGQSDEKDQGWGPVTLIIRFDSQQPGQEILINSEPAPSGGHIKEKQEHLPRKFFKSFCGWLQSKRGLPV